MFFLRIRTNPERGTQNRWICTAHPLLISTARAANSVCHIYDTGDGSSRSYWTPLLPLSSLPNWKKEEVVKREETFIICLRSNRHEVGVGGGWGTDTQTINVMQTVKTWCGRSTVESGWREEEFFLPSGWKRRNSTSSSPIFFFFFLFQRPSTSLLLYLVGNSGGKKFVCQECNNTAADRPFSTSAFCLWGASSPPSSSPPPPFSMMFQATGR